MNDAIRIAIRATTEADLALKATIETTTAARIAVKIADTAVGKAKAVAVSAKATYQAIKISSDN